MKLINVYVSMFEEGMQNMFSRWFCLVIILLSAVSYCPTVANAQGFTFFGYLQRYDSQKMSDPAKSGYTGGVFCEIGGDFGKYSSKAMAPKTFAFGWALDVFAGLGTYNSKFTAELSADIFGVTGRYKIDNENTVGLFYDPIVVYATPVGGYIGSKLVLKYSYKDFQLNIARGGAGFFYGCIAPKEDGALHSVELQYWLGQPYFDFVGVRYSSIPFNDSMSSGIMLFYGFGIR